MGTKVQRCCDPTLWSRHVRGCCNRQLWTSNSCEAILFFGPPTSVELSCFKDDSAEPTLQPCGGGTRCSAAIQHCGADLVTMCCNGGQLRTSNSCGAVQMMLQSLHSNPCGETRCSAAIQHCGADLVTGCCRVYNPTLWRASMQCCYPPLWSRLVRGHLMHSKT